MDVLELMAYPTASNHQETRMKLMTLFFTSLTIMTSTVMADVTVLSGKPGGSYYGYGATLSSLLNQRKVVTFHTPTRGSVENIETLAAAKPEEQYIAVMQGDVFADYLDANPAAWSKLKVIGLIDQDVGECVFAVSPKKYGIDDIDDLVDPKNKYSIAVGEEGAGTSVTWRKFTKMWPELIATSPAYVDGADVFNAMNLKATKMPQLPAPEVYMWVANPRNQSNTNLRAAMAAKFEFLQIQDRHLNAKLPDGTPVYTRRTITLETGGFFTKDVKTLCTDILVVGVNLDDKAAKVVGEVLLLNAGQFTR